MEYFERTFDSKGPARQRAQHHVKNQVWPLWWLHALVREDVKKLRNTRAWKRQGNVNIMGILTKLK